VYINQVHRQNLPTSFPQGNSAVVVGDLSRQALACYMHSSLVVAAYPPPLCNAIRLSISPPHFISPRYLLPRMNYKSMNTIMHKTAKLPCAILFCRQASKHQSSQTTSNQELTCSPFPAKFALVYISPCISRNHVVVSLRLSFFILDPRAWLWG
jgi:hypothetical protein